MKVICIALSMFALAACLDTARAQQEHRYEIPAMERTETPAPSFSEKERKEAAAARALAERRRDMIEDCEQNHGSEIDCEREVDIELGAEGLLWGARFIHLRPLR